MISASLNQLPRHSSANRSGWHVLNCCALLACTALLTLVSPEPLLAQEEAAAPATLGPEVPGRRLFELDPYDEIRLKDGTVIEARPLRVRGKSLPVKPKNKDVLKFYYSEISTAEGINTSQQYEVEWEYIGEIRYFEELILDRAKALSQAGRFDDAFFYFQYLMRHHGKLKGLEQAINDYYFAEAKTKLAANNHAHSLALLNELYKREPEYPQLSGLLAESMQPLFIEAMDGEKYDVVRQLLDSLEKKFPQEPTVEIWKQGLVDLAEGHLEEAREFSEAKNYHSARGAAFAAVRIWPLPEALQILSEAQRQAPQISIGVSELAQGADPVSLDDWNSRRAARLHYRTLLEYLGPGAQGGTYQCPVGEFEKLDLGLQLRFHLRPDIRWADRPQPMTGVDLAQQLLKMARPTDRTYDRGWDVTFDKVTVNELFEVNVRLTHEHILPDSFLQVRLAPAWSKSQFVPANGPYIVHETVNNERHYRARSDYFAAGPAQPREVVEVRFEDARQAVDALRRGEIAALERIPPWQITALESFEQIAVKAYDVPTLHCLLFAGDSPLLKNSSFRRALVLGINRQAIVDQLLEGRESRVTRVVSGPFLFGRSFEDPISYAYNRDVTPRPYDPRLAITLASIGVRESLAKEGEELTTTIPTLRLLVPRHDVARVACRSIQRQLKLVGIPIELVERPDAGLPPAHDLRYVEMMPWEPLVDAGRILGPGGLAQTDSPYLRLALRELAATKDWKAAGDKLKEIHQLAYHDISVVPLWQFEEHYAYHRAVKELEGGRVTFYQNVEEWTSPPAILSKVEVAAK